MAGDPVDAPAATEGTGLYNSPPPDSFVAPLQLSHIASIPIAIGNFL